MPPPCSPPSVDGKRDLAARCGQVGVGCRAPSPMFYLSEVAALVRQFLRYL